MKRYGVADSSSTDVKRELVLLRGGGCAWNKCSFCDFCDDHSQFGHLNYTEVNQKVLSQVTGEFGVLQILCSGSFSELDILTVNHIKRLCVELNIRHLIIESHIMYKDSFDQLRNAFLPTKLSIIAGVESFDVNYRELVLTKGYGFVGARYIANQFNWCNLLYGLESSDLDRLKHDVLLALDYFEVVSINMFTDNTTTLKRDDAKVVEFFASDFFNQVVRNNPQIELLDSKLGREFNLDNVGMVLSENEGGI